MLQKHFADSSGRIHFWNKAAADRGILTSRPGNLLVQQHLYSRYNDDGTKDTALEAAYSNLEGATDGVLKRVIPLVLRGDYPIIDDADKGALTLFLYEQWRRVPEMFERIAPRDQMRSQIAAVIQTYEEKRGKPIDDSLKARFLTEKYVEKFRQNARIGALIKKSDRILNALVGKGIYFGLTDSKTSFLLGSMPVMKLTAAHVELADPSVEVWLPIHRRVAMVFAGEIYAGGTIPLARKDVRKINTETAKRSQLLLSHSRNELERALVSAGLH